MKKSLRTLLCTGIATVFLFTTGYLGFNYSKKWVNERIQTAITQYEKNDKQWTDQKLDETITQYEREDKKTTEEMVKENINQYEQKDQQWTKQTFETKLPLEQIAKVSNSAYRVIIWASYKTQTGELIEGPVGTGSGILLKGGYLLTARHVTDPPQIQKRIEHPLYGVLEYDHSEFSLTNKKISEDTTKKDCLERIIKGPTQELDYSLLKLKDNTNLPFYSYGINVSDKIELGMQTVAIGYPLSLGKNVRLGNISQTESDFGKHWLTYKNDVLPSDSGGPLFIVENGKIRLVAITIAGYQIPQSFDGAQIVNINYGIKISSVIKDMENQLKTGKLDPKVAKEVKNFLKLNRE